MVKTPVLIGCYVCAIASADLTVAHFGQIALPFTAWILIPFDLAARDLLHDRWRGRGLPFRMAGLVGSGSCVSALINSASSRVALASFIAFNTAGFVATLVYQLLVSRPRVLKMNTANLTAAVTDSIVFPTIAFSVVDWRLSAAQAGSKFLGGFFWSFLLVRFIIGRGAFTKTH